MLYVVHVWLSPSHGESEPHWQCSCSEAEEVYRCPGEDDWLDEPVVAEEP